MGVDQETGDSAEDCMQRQAGVPFHANLAKFGRVFGRNPKPETRQTYIAVKFVKLTLETV